MTRISMPAMLPLQCLICFSLGAASGLVQAGNYYFSATELAALAGSTQPSISKDGFSIGLSAVGGSQLFTEVDAQSGGLKLWPTYLGNGAYQFEFSQPAYRVTYEYAGLTASRYGPREWMAYTSVLTPWVCAHASSLPCQTQFNELSSLNREYLKNIPGPTWVTSPAGTSLSANSAILVNGTQIYTAVPTDVDVSFSASGAIDYNAANAARTPTSAVTLYHQSETGSLSLTGIRIRTAVPLFLDFGSNLDANIALKASTVDTKLALTIDSSPQYRGGGGNRAAPLQGMQQVIASYVQEIFDRSGVAVYVTTTKPVEPALTVRFVEPLLGDPTLQGMAYDTSGKIGTGLDRFDKRKDGFVAVFTGGVGSANFNARELAETVAHEAAHGYGLPHLLDPGYPGEVMDYVDAVDPMFSQVPLALVEYRKIGDALVPVALGGTSNPAYHFRKYVLGEADEDIGLTPGSYDIQPSFESVVRSTLSFVGLPAGIHSLFAQGSADANLGSTSGAFELLGTNIAGGGNLEFFSEVGQPITILGSTDGEQLDVVFVIDGVGLGSFDGRAATGRIVAIDGISAPVELGTFAYSSTLVTSVPEPSQLALLLAGLFCTVGLAAGSRRRWSDVSLAPAQALEAAGR